MSALPRSVPVQPGPLLEGRLENWGAWQRWRTEGKQAASAEGAHRGPQRNHWEVGAAPFLQGKAISAQDGAEIESGVNLLAEEYQAMMRARYIERASAHRLRRVAVAVGFKDANDGAVAAALSMGRMLLLRILEEPMVLRKLRIRERVKKILCQTLDYNDET